MVDSFTESTPIGFMQEIGDSIKGVLAGVVIILLATCCLPVNEYFYVKTKLALEAGMGKTVEVPSDKVDSANDKKLVLVSGKAKTDATLADSVFGVSVPAMRLARKVEMWQYSEKSKTSGKRKNKTTTYSYPPDWSDKHIDSAQFKGKKSADYRNPGSMPYKGESWSATSAKLGAFDLTKGQISSFSATKTLSPGGGSAKPSASATPTASAAPADPLTCPICKKKLKSAAGVKDHLKAKHKGEAVPVSTGGGSSSSGGAAMGPAGYKVDGEFLFNGKGTRAAPKIGDVRVSWRYAPPSADVTVVGQQKAGKLESFKEDDIEMSALHMGIQTVAEFYTQEQESNTMRLFGIRIAGTIMMIVGFGLIFAPLGAVADIIPVVGDIVDMGTGCAAMGLGVIAALIMMAIGWVFSRPLIGILMLVIGIGGLVGLIVLAKKMTAGKKAEKAAAGGAPAAPPAEPPAAPPAEPPAEPPAA